MKWIGTNSFGFTGTNESARLSIIAFGCIDCFLQRLGSDQIEKFVLNSLPWYIAYTQQLGIPTVIVM